MMGSTFWFTEKSAFYFLGSMLNFHKTISHFEMGIILYTDSDIRVEGIILQHNCERRETFQSTDDFF